MKDVRTKQGEPQLHHYERHLSRQAITGENGVGFGGLGIFQGVPDRQAEQGKAVWMTNWIALDLDTITPEQAEPLLEHLLRLDLYFYVTRGTTRRGCHIWILVEGYIPQATAFQIAKKLAKAAVRLGSPKVETFPSDAYGSGAGILLPYRGAEDDFGFNPLLEAFSLQEIPLSQTHNLQRNDPDVLKAVLDEAGPTKKVRVQERKFEGDPEPVWLAELERIRPSWRQGNRNWLALAVSAFGLFIGIEPDRVRHDLDLIMLNAKDAERSSHLAAVDNTIRRWQKLQAGNTNQKIAFHKFYMRAGLESPVGGCVDESARMLLKYLDADIKGRSWPGRGGETELTTYVWLLTLARRHGVSVPNGVEISVSIRQIAEGIGKSASVAQEAVKRLTSSGLVTRASKGQGEDAGCLILLGSIPNTQSTLLCVEGVTSTASSRELPSPMLGTPSQTRILNHARANFVIFALQNHKNPMSCLEIAKCIKRNTRDTRHTLQKMITLRVLERNGNTYALIANLDQRLIEIADESGATQQATKRKERHERERQERQASLLKRPRQTRQTVPTVATLPEPARSDTNPERVQGLYQNFLLAQIKPEQIDSAREMLYEVAADPTRCAAVLRHLSDADRFQAASIALGEKTVLEAASIAAQTKDSLSKPRPSTRHLRPVFDPEIQPKKRTQVTAAPSERTLPPVSSRSQPDVLKRTVVTPVKHD